MADLQLLPGRTQQALGHIKPLGQPFELALHGGGQTVPPMRQLLQGLPAVGADQLGRRRGGRRPHIGHEIGKGEIGFVPHPAHHRQTATSQPAHQPFMVESVQILERSAAPHHQQHVALLPGFGRPDGGNQLGRCLLPLHGSRVDDDAQLGCPPAQRGQHILQGRGLQRTDDAHGVDVGRQQLLATRIEQPLGLQQGLEPGKALPDIASAGQLHALDPQLEVTPCLVERHTGQHLHLVALARAEVHPGSSRTEHDRTHRRARVLEGEIPVPAGGPREVGQLAHHLHHPERVLQYTTSHPVELADRQGLFGRKRLRTSCKNAFLLFHRHGNLLEAERRHGQPSLRKVPVQTI